MQSSPKPFQAPTTCWDLPRQFDRVLRLTKLTLQCFLVSLCCAGCVLSYDRSGDKEYRPYIGQAVTLTRPLDLVGVRNTWFGRGEDHTLRYARYGLAEQRRAQMPLYARLPKGYPATIDSVREEITDDDGVPVIYGHIVNPTTGERASFAYKYYGDVQPLPWQLAAFAH